MLKNILNTKGQTFIVVMMLMLMALFIGVTVSSRFIRSLHTISSSDNSSRAQAVAEAGVERMLALPSTTLQGYINSNSCGTNCQMQITDPSGQVITADISLSFLGNSSQSFLSNLHTDDTVEVSLTGFTSGKSIYVCWNNAMSVVGQYIYTQSSVIKSTPFAYNPVISINGNNNFQTASAQFGYSNCFSVIAANTPLSMRLKSAYSEGTVYIIPEAGATIPIQGVQITSVGKAGSATRKVIVFKSYSYTPSYFDHVLYQKSQTDSLSN